MKDFENDIISCIRILSAGGVILYPTDTIWGLGCDATNATAVDNIFRIKKRADSKSLITLIAEESDIFQYTTQPDLSIFDHLKKKTKPTTVIYDGGIGVAENLLGADGSVAIRITSEPFCRHLIKRFRKPIVSTSANISGQDPPATFQDINAIIISAVDYVVKYRQEDLTRSLPSTIIRWKNGKEIIIRE